MHVLFLLDSLSMGGSERKSVKLVNELMARGHVVSLAYLQDPAVLLPEVDYRVFTCCLDRKGKFSIKALRNLHRLVVDRKVDVILCMNLYPVLYASVLKRLASSLKIRLILATNTTEFARFRDKIFMFLYAPMIRRIDFVIYGCKFQFELWAEKYKVRKTKSSVIYNGVDLARFDARNVSDNLRDELALQHEFVVGCVARFDLEKNHAALLEVVGQRKSAGSRIHVLLVGDGPEYGSLVNLAKTLNVSDRIHFLGRMADVRKALATMDVFVLPSKSVETFSNAALEAMAMAIPTVLSNVGGAAEMVNDGRDGYVYERDDLQRLSDRLAVLENNPELRMRLGRSARATVESKFQFARMVDEYEALLYDTEVVGA